MKKSTEELWNELILAKDYQEFLEQNRDELETATLQEIISKYMIKYNRSKAEVIKSAELDLTYGYQILAGMKKNPARDKLIQLAFGFPLTIKEANNMLRAGNVSELSVRNRRDVVIMFCLQRQMAVSECEEKLIQAGVETMIR